MKKPIPLTSRRKKIPVQESYEYRVSVTRFGENDYEAMAAWDEMWRMLLAPLLEEPQAEAA